MKYQTLDDRAADNVQRQKATARATAPLLLLAILRDIHDVVLEDEKIGFTVAGDTNHIPVVVLDPPVDDLAIGELDVDRALLLSKIFEVGGFLVCFLRGRRLAATACARGSSWMKRHARIVHGERCTFASRRLANPPGLKKKSDEILRARYLYQGSKAL